MDDKSPARRVHGTQRHHLLLRFAVIHDIVQIPGHIRVVLPSRQLDLHQGITHLHVDDILLRLGIFFYDVPLKILNPQRIHRKDHLARRIHHNVFILRKSVDQIFVEKSQRLDIHALRRLQLPHLAGVKVDDPDTCTVVSIFPFHPSPTGVGRGGNKMPRFDPTLDDLILVPFDIHLIQIPTHEQEQLVLFIYIR